MEYLCVIFLLDSFPNYFYKSEGKIIPSGYAWKWVLLKYILAEIYPDVAKCQRKHMDWLCERAILTQKKITYAEINDIILNFIEGENMDYRSVDSVLEVDNAVQYPLKLLITINPPGFPAHRSILKIRTPIMLLRNLCPPICATGQDYVRLLFRRNVVEATIITGCAKGESVFIPRIPLMPSD